MTLGLVVMLVGVFAVPALLVWSGHRLRRRSSRWRSAFWGGVIGHLAALVIGSIAAMNPAEAWAPTDTWRGALGLWSFAVLPLIGGLMGMMAWKRQY